MMNHNGSVCHTVARALCLNHQVFEALIVVVRQARDVRNNEVVAIKKMSYSGKQTNEVTKS